MTGPAIAREDLASLLKWYVDNGIDETIGEGSDRTASRPPPPAAARAAANAPEPAIAQRPTAPTPIRPATPFPRPRPGAARIAAARRGCARAGAALRDHCPISKRPSVPSRAAPSKRTAKHTVFADGVAGAPVMVVGEAPGADEDRLASPS